MLATRAIGQTTLRVTELGLGTASFGNLYRPREDEVVADAMEAAWDAGMRYVDTAPHYGFGLSERRVGDALRGHKRGDFVLSTKAGRLLRPDPGGSQDTERFGFYSPMPFAPYFDYSYDAVMRSAENSLQRLGLSSFDILLIHDIGPLTHGSDHDRHWRDFVEGGLRAAEVLRGEGTVQAIGLGVNEWEVCEAAMDYGRFDCFLLAGRYTLLEQSALESFFPRCEIHGASLIIGGAYNSGILASGTRGEGPLHYNYAPAPPEVIARVRKIEDICADHAVPLAAAALQFPLAHPLVSTLIPGAGDRVELERSMANYACDIPDALWGDLKSAGLIREDAPVPGGEGAVR